MQGADSEYIAQCVNGDVEAFSVLVDRYQQAVYATAFYYAGNTGAAEDIAQEAFFTAYRNLPRLREYDRFGRWLKEITCRTAANWLRRHGRKVRFETPLPFRRTVSIEDVREGPRQGLERAEVMERIQLAIDSLPERYRLPVVLRYMQELSYDEIAAFTGMKRDEVRGVLQRAGRQLRDLLSDINEEGEGESQWRRVRK